MTTSAFKRKLADIGLLDPALLPLNEEVVAEIKTARAEGRHVALVSASDARQTEAVAQHLGLFDSWHGTATETGGENLSGEAKAGRGSTSTGS